VDIKKTMANFGYIGCQKNVPKAPWYAYEIFPTHEDWTGPFILPSARGGGKGDCLTQTWQDHSRPKLFSNLNLDATNMVEFLPSMRTAACHAHIVTRCYTNTNAWDYTNLAIAYIYCQYTKELVCIGLAAAAPETCAYNFNYIQNGLHLAEYHTLRHFRIKYLLTKWRRLTPLIGKIAITLRTMYTEVTYRPWNKGAIAAKYNFETAPIM
jgi:hypothetical protein